MTIFIFLCLIPFPSKAGEESFSLNFWPFFQYTSDPLKGVKEIEALGPLFLWKKDLRQTQWAIRPLLHSTEDETEPLSRLEFLYPFGKYQVKKDEKKGYLAPLSLFREETSDGKRKWDFQFFPFFVGETERGEDYFGLFPLYGTLLDRYGKEEIRFFLWPLYGESVSDGVRTTNLLWPFFSFIEGKKKKGYRLWPLYGKREEAGVSDSEFFLWPFFIRQRKGLDTDDPVEEKMFFPFYASKESKRFESKTFLWPFFAHARDRLSGFEQLDFPWPLFQSVKGENLRGIKFFPLYGYKVKEGEMKRTFILYPLYQSEEDRMGEGQEKTTRILLLSRIRTGEDRQGLEKGHSLRIWPFFDYERKETGQEELSFFYLFPFKDEGFERNLFPLFRIFRWEKDADGSISANLFWGFYKRRKHEDRESWEIAHLAGLKKGRKGKELSLLKGLFLYKSDGRTSDLRLFFLPFHLRWFHQKEGHLKSVEKEHADGQQENRDTGDRLVCSGEDPFQY